MPGFAISHPHSEPMHSQEDSDTNRESPPASAQIPDRESCRTSGEPCVASATHLSECDGPWYSHTGDASKLSPTPGVRSGKRLLTRQANHLGSLPRSDAGRPPLAGHVSKTIHPFCYKALSPFETIVSVQSTACADLLQRQALCRQQDHLGSPTIPLLSSMRIGHTFNVDSCSDVNSNLTDFLAMEHPHDRMYSTVNSGTQH